MKVAAVATVLNEGDIIEHTMRHLFAEGIDTIYIAHGPSTDNTAALINPDRWANRVVVYEDDSPIHYQPKWIDQLTEQAGEDGHDWILPVDADEFWYSLHGDSIHDVLDGIRMDRVTVPMIRHLSWSLRMELTTLPKIAFRYQPGVHVFNGNHDCTVPGASANGVMALREVCYRGFEHFKRKTRERNATIDPTLPIGDGAHQRQYAGMTDEQLHVAWLEYKRIPTIKDPIPSRIQNTPSW